MRVTLADVLYFIGVTFFLRYVVLGWVARIVIDWAQKRLVKSEADLANWMHHKLKAMRQGHQYPTIAECTDGECKKYI